MQKVKRLTPKEEAALKAEEEAVRQARRKNFRRELMGIFGGIGLAMAISALIPAIRENYSLGLVILWGGAIGGAVMSMDRFERAGAALTKKDNRALNYAVGLGIPVVILILLFSLQ
ncbi:MAG: hypothetical protein HUU38_06135 [Anaerolineales bacterium]|nr:hypothetical protein [Anaerolineales bacterium]